MRLSLKWIGHGGAGGARTGAQRAARARGPTGAFSALGHQLSRADDLLNALYTSDQQHRSHSQPSVDPAARTMAANHVNLNHLSPPSRSRAPSRAGPTSSLQLHYRTLVSSLTSLTNSLAPASSSTSTDILSSIDQSFVHLSEFERLAGRADPEGELSRLGEQKEGRWRDELDGWGTQLWNVSTVRKYGEGEAEGQEKYRRELVVAKCEWRACAGFGQALLGRPGRVV